MNDPTPDITRNDSSNSSVLVVQRNLTSLYVDRSLRRWVVRDTDGQFWLLPQREDAWRHRSPFQLTSDTELEPVPGHYKPLLGIPL